jgi:hypothetical protein
MSKHIRIWRAVLGHYLNLCESRARVVTHLRTAGEDSCPHISGHHGKRSSAVFGKWKTPPKMGGNKSPRAISMTWT